MLFNLSISKQWLIEVCSIFNCSNVHWKTLQIEKHCCHSSGGEKIIGSCFICHRINSIESEYVCMLNCCIQNNCIWLGALMCAFFFFFFLVCAVSLCMWSDVFVVSPSPSSILFNATLINLLPPNEVPLLPAIHAQHVTFHFFVWVAIFRWNYSIVCSLLTAHWTIVIYLVVNFFVCSFVWVSNHLSI